MKFDIKDKIPFEELHNPLYRIVCATSNSTEGYVGETVWHIVERVKDHNDWNNHPYLVKNLVEATVCQ